MAYAELASVLKGGSLGGISDTKPTCASMPVASEHPKVEDFVWEPPAWEGLLVHPPPWAGVVGPCCLALEPPKNAM